MDSRRHLLIIASILSAMWPTWLWYGARMTDGSDEPYGILALLAGGFLLWRDRHTLEPTLKRMVIAIGLLLVTSVFHHLLPNLITGLAAVFILALAWGNPFRNLGIWALLVLALPLIASLQFYLGYPMRLIAAVSAEMILNCFGQEIARSGTLLMWQGSQVGVDPPCSGIGMLWLGLFLAALLCGLKRYPPSTFLVVMITAMVAIVAANAIRVTLLFLKESDQVSLPD
ncbi:MAG: archaeosortase/exosortase family protein, partial [Verrucomicrobiota bacterium]